MKTCPFCKAEIEENARFCLYCMTSLEEKQVIRIQKTRQRWPVILAAVFVLVLVVGGIWLILGGDDSVPTSSDSSANQTSAVSLSTSSTGQNQVVVDPTASITADNTHTTSGNQSQSTTGSKTDGQRSSTNAKITTSTTSGRTSSLHNVPTSSKTATTTGATSAKSTTSKIPTVTTSSTSATGSTVSQAVYAYRKAQYGDDFSVSYPIPANAIVITGVTTPSSGGTYVIPASIDGHPVLAIMGGAFSGADVKNSVKKVVVPASVKTIWNYAFAGCYGLTDIYFCGNAIYTEANAFPDADKRTGILTIHCSASCHDRNLRLYKNSVGTFDALYEEWNG